MKKIKLMISLLLLCGCTSQITIEEGAHLLIAVENEAYGEAITALWDETYPEHKSTVIYEVVEENEILSYAINSEKIPYDVFLIKDEDVANVFDQVKEIPIKQAKKFEIEPNPAFYEVINEVKNVYYPLSAEGMLYAVNLTQMAKTNIDERVFENFETLFKYSKQKPFYYYDDEIFNLPLLSSDLSYLPNKKTHLVEFGSDGFSTSLRNYKNILRSLSLQSDPASFDNWFIHQNYLSGLIGPWMQADQSEDMNGNILRYQKLPKIQDLQLKTLAQSQGYVIQAETVYPNAALKLIDLMHSQSGMQALLNTSSWIPLINEEQVDLFTMDQKHMKEKVIAMNGSMQRNLLALYQNTQVGAIEVFNDPVVQMSMKKYILDGSSLEETVVECSLRSDVWLLEQSKSLIK